MSLRLLTYNIRLGGRGREQSLAAVVNHCKADVVVLQEAVRPEIIERLSSACGMKTWGSVRGQSVAFMSKVDVAYRAWHEIRFARRQYLELVLAESKIRIFGVHLSAVHSNITERRRTYELRSVLGVTAGKQEQFHVLTGDFNTLAPGENLDVSRLPPRLRAVVWLTGGTIRWSTIRLMLDRGYADGYRMTHKEDAGFTFPTWNPHVRLDYAFVPAPFASRLRSCEIMRDAPGVLEASDHFPLLSEISEI